MPLPWRFSSEDCPVVYHYTSLEAGRAIVETRTFRLSEHTRLNDTSEFAYARERLLRLIQNRHAYTDLGTRLFLVAAMESLSGNTGLMIGSLTARSDDLGQWRSYAANGAGCVIGLDADYLQQEAGVTTRRVVYDDDTVDSLLGSSLEVLQEQRDADPEDHETMMEFARCLVADLFSIKHPCFADEREVRISRMLIRTAEGGLEDPGGHTAQGAETPTLPVAVREGPFGATRYIALPLERADGSSAIVSVGLGPTVARDAASANCAAFEACGVQVWRSALPYRANGE